MAEGYGIQIDSPEDLSFSIEIHLSQGFLDLSEFEGALSEAVKETANEARDFWYSEAGRRLKSSRIEYQNAIKVGSVDGESFSLELDGGFIPYAVEVGTDAYDMDIKRGQIVPLNVDREVHFTNPTVFRTGNGEPWKHPGFEGRHITNDVVDEIITNLLPKNLQKALDKL